MRPLRVGVVGVGHLGRVHARILSGMKDVTLVGVADPEEANRREVSQACRTQSFAGHRHLVGLVDAAVIATPTQSHHAVAVDMLRSGIHLLVEKPLAATAAEAEELVDTSRQRGLVLQVGHVERFNPAFAVAADRIGAPKYIEAVRRSGYTFRSTDIGVVLDLMIHDIDLVLSLVGCGVRRVEALGLAIFGRHEDVAHARLIFENGCVANLTASRASRSPARSLQVWSGRGMATLDLAARTATIIQPSAALLSRSVDQEHLLPEERNRLRTTLLDEHLPQEALCVSPCDPLSAELADFCESIRDGRSPRVPGEAGRDAISVAESILARIATHSWDGSGYGPQGPLLAEPPHVLRGPHWHYADSTVAARRREAS